MNFQAYLRYAFAHPSQGGGIRPRDFQAVEYMMRRADRMLEQIFEDSSATDMHVTEEVSKWYAEQNRPRNPVSSSSAADAKAQEGRSEASSGGSPPNDPSGSQVRPRTTRTSLLKKK